MTWKEINQNRGTKRNYDNKKYNLDKKRYNSCRHRYKN